MVTLVLRGLRTPEDILVIIAVPVEPPVRIIIGPVERLVEWTDRPDDYDPLASTILPGYGAKHSRQSEKHQRCQDEPTNSAYSA